MLTVGSLFSGIGGLELGLERAGMRVRWQVEIDDFCLRVLAKHWPDVPKYRDVRDVGKHNLEPVDLICGGFPCQPHSLAGRRKASKDERDMWPEFYRIVKELRPRWVLAENVPGILTSEGGRYFARIILQMAQLGYRVEWESLPAAAFGAPHVRYRVFIVAYSRCQHGHQRGEVQRVLRGVSENQQERYHSQRSGKTHTSKDVAYAKGERRQAGGLPVGETPQDSKLGSCGDDVPHASVKGLERPLQPEVFPSELRGNWRKGEWAPEPDVGRVAHGVPNRVDRLRALGNAVVPQVAEWIGRRILEVDNALSL